MKPISSDILVVELLNLAAGTFLDTILWNIKLVQSEFSMTMQQLKLLTRPANVKLVILVLSAGLPQ